jgi:hypothetical protein
MNKSKFITNKKWKEKHHAKGEKEKKSPTCPRLRKRKA